jgi:hypothetical protein
MAVVVVVVHVDNDKLVVVVVFDPVENFSFSPAYLLARLDPEQGVLHRPKR